MRERDFGREDGSGLFSGAGSLLDASESVDSDLGFIELPA